MALSLLFIKLISDSTITLLDSILQHADQEYLRILRDKLSEVRLLYETGKMSREDYKKLESELAERIKSVLTNRNRRGGIMEMGL